MATSDLLPWSSTGYANEEAQEAVQVAGVDKLPGPSFGMGGEMDLISSGEFSNVWPACILQIHQLEPPR